MSRICPIILCLEGHTFGGRRWYNSKGNMAVSSLWSRNLMRENTPARNPLIGYVYTALYSGKPYFSYNSEPSTFQLQLCYLYPPGLRTEKPRFVPFASVSKDLPSLQRIVTLPRMCEDYFSTWLGAGRCCYQNSSAHQTIFADDTSFLLKEDR